MFTTTRTRYALSVAAFSLRLCLQLLGYSLCIEDVLEPVEVIRTCVYKKNNVIMIPVGMQAKRDMIGGSVGSVNGSKRVLVQMGLDLEVSSKAYEERLNEADATGSIPVDLSLRFQIK
ncbi:hypothetical protein Tco_1482760 [Tanacetum coccineum]